MQTRRGVARSGAGNGIDDGLETRRWNGTKSAFADCTSAIGADSKNSARGKGSDVLVSGRIQPSPGTGEGGEPKRAGRGREAEVGTRDRLLMRQRLQLFSTWHSALGTCFSVVATGHTDR